MNNANEFEYVKSNAWKKEFESDPKFSETKKGLQVLRQNTLYYNHRKNESSIYWKCSHAKKECKCKGSLVINDQDQIVAQVQHNGHDPLSDNEVIAFEI